MTREEIKEVLPHREPMLLVDEAYKNEDGTATGVYNVRGDEFFLQGHFPDAPVVPGVWEVHLFFYTLLVFGTRLSDGAASAAGASARRSLPKKKIAMVPGPTCVPVHMS